MPNDKNSKPSGGKPTICDFVDEVLSYADMNTCTDMSEEVTDIGDAFRDYIGARAEHMECPPEWEAAWAEYVCCEGEDNDDYDDDYDDDYEEDPDDYDCDSYDGVS